MGLGYVLGCLFSILFRKIDKFKLMEGIYSKSKKIIKSDIFFIILLTLFFAALRYTFLLVPNEEINNFITFILCIDISNTEFINLKTYGNRNFYNSISTITKSLVGGFIGPILYTGLFGNYFGVLFYIIFLTNDLIDNKFINFITKILNVIPSLLAGLIFYTIYIIRNKTFKIDFKGDFFINFFLNPLLNLNIIAANLESINFYYLNKENNLKNYVNGKQNIDSICIKEFLNYTYFVCLLSFLVFITTVIYKVI
jgi:hypothetical protein